MPKSLKLPAHVVTIKLPIWLLWHYCRRPHEPLSNPVALASLGGGNAWSDCFPARISFCGGEAPLVIDGRRRAEYMVNAGRGAELAPVETLYRYPPCIAKAAD